MHLLDLLKKCSILNEYMIFVDYVRTYHAEFNYENLELAIDKAIDTCIQKSVLKDFLIAHRSEVAKVTHLDYTFDRQLLLEREEARTEGRAEGIAEGRVEGRAEGLDEGRKQERMESIRRLVSIGVSKDTLLAELGYSEEEYTLAVGK